MRRAAEPVFQFGFPARVSPFQHIPVRRIGTHFVDLAERRERLFPGSVQSGAESRAMAADAMNDAWDSAVDTYERGASVVSDKFSAVRPTVDAKTDELRAKVDLARERMDQLRDSLSDAVANASDQVKDAASAVADRVSAMTDPAAPAEQAAEAVHVEVVDADDETPEA